MSSVRPASRCLCFYSRRPFDHAPSLDPACSRDGAVRLWDCGTATCIATVCQTDVIVNGLAVAEYPSGATSDPTPARQ